VLDAAGFGDVETVAVENTFFGGNIAVAGLLTFADLARSAACVPAGRRVLAPEVCLSNGRFLDGGRPEDLPRAVEFVAEDGDSLFRALTGRPRRRAAASAAREAR
jgi:NifB/MoaA-like Fe-S oxidoreductase